MQEKVGKIIGMMFQKYFEHKHIPTQYFITCSKYNYVKRHKSFKY